VCGCSNSWVRLPHYPQYPPDLEKEALCRIVASRTNGVETLRAEDVASTVDTPEAGGSCHLILLVTREGYARIKGYVRLFGKTVFDAAASPAKAELFVPSKGTVTTYRRRPGDERLAWAFDLLVRVLLANVPAESDEYAVASVQDGDWLSIAVRRGQAVRERLLVDRRCLLVRERTLLRDDGTPGCIVTYNRYAKIGAYWWPRQWEIAVPDQEIYTHLEFDPRRVSFDRRLDPELFVLKLPPDVERVDGTKRLDEAAHRFGP
jgi:hypothetical protein